MVQEEFFQRVCRFAQERGKPVLEAFAFAPAAIFVCQEGGNCGLYFDQRYFRVSDISLWDSVREQAQGLFPLGTGPLGFLPYTLNDYKREERLLQVYAQRAIEPFDKKDEWYKEPESLDCNS